MQTRTFIGILEDVEKVLPELKNLLEDLIMVKNQINVGNFDCLEIKDRGDANVKGKVDELKSKLAVEMVTKELKTRAAMAIQTSDTYFKAITKCGLDTSYELMQHYDYSFMTMPSFQDEAKPIDVSILSSGSVGIGLIKTSPPQLAIISGMQFDKKSNTAPTLFQTSQHKQRLKVKKPVKFTFEGATTRGPGL